MATVSLWRILLLAMGNVTLEAAERSNPTSKEWWLLGRRRAERSYSTFKVRRGGRPR